MNKQLKITYYYLYTLLNSILIGLVLYAFLYTVNSLLHLLWIGEHEGNGLILNSNSVVIVSFILIGAVISGFITSKFQQLPPTPKETAGNIQRTLDYDFKKIILIFFGSMIPLIIGASVGPEASLLVLGIIFINQLNYKTELLADKLDIDIPRKTGNKLKNVIKQDYKYLIELAIITIGIALPLVMLSYLDHFPSFFTRLEVGEINFHDLIFVLPLLLVGYLTAHYFIFIEHRLELLFSKINNIYISVLIGAAAISIAALYFPLIILSGEATLPILLETYSKYSALTLLLIALLNVILTNLCISSKLRGGHIFPVLYTAFSLGLAFSVYFDIDATVAITAITAAMTLKLYKNMMAIFVLLSLFIPLVYLSVIFLLIFLIRNAHKLVTGGFSIVDIENEYEIE